MREKAHLRVAKSQIVIVFTIDSHRRKETGLPDHEKKRRDIAISVTIERVKSVRLSAIGIWYSVATKYESYRRFPSQASPPKRRFYSSVMAINKVSRGKMGGTWTRRFFYSEYFLTSVPSQIYTCASLLLMETGLCKSPQCAVSPMPSWLFVG